VSRVGGMADGGGGARAGRRREGHVQGVGRRRPRRSRRRAQMFRAVRGDVPEARGVASSRAEPDAARAHRARKAERRDGPRERSVGARIRGDQLRRSPQGELLGEADVRPGGVRPRGRAHGGDGGGREDGRRGKARRVRVPGQRRRVGVRVSASEARPGHHTGPHTTAFAWWTPFLEDCWVPPRAFVSLRPGSHAFDARPRCLST
jgi:hypothetical protein